MHGDSKNPRSPGATGTDDLDRRLVLLLQANARESTATLARKLGVARTTVVARLARLGFLLSTYISTIIHDEMTFSDSSSSEDCFQSSSSLLRVRSSSTPSVGDPP